MEKELPGIVLPEVKKPRAPEHAPLHNSFIELETIRRHLEKTNDVNTVDSLKAELNSLSTEDYLTTGRGQENIAQARRQHLDKEQRFEQQMARGAEIRRARAANAGLLERFKNSLATMSERIFGKPPARETKTGNENSAERPE
ncbi:MAG: hypothetical protein AAB776_01170 [Patescibacteria group bacterium]